MYVDFCRQGLPTFEAPVVVEKTQEVSSRDTAGLEIPDGVFGFYFYDTDEDNNRVNLSPWHFIGGKVDGKSIKFFDGIVTSTFILEDDHVLVAV